jgi:hypothetical protein
MPLNSKQKPLTHGLQSLDDSVCGQRRHPKPGTDMVGMNRLVMGGVDDYPRGFENSK